MVTSAPSTFEVSLTPELQSLLAEEVARTGSPPNRVVGDALFDWLRRRQRRRRVDAEIAAYATEHAGTEFDLDLQLEEAGLECLDRCEVEGDDWMALPQFADS